MSLNTLNVGKLKFIVASLKGLPAVQLGAELDRLCVESNHDKIMYRQTKTLFHFTIVLYVTPFIMFIVVSSARCPKEEYSFYGSSRRWGGNVYAHGCSYFIGL